MLVTDAALLVEAGAHLRFDRLVVVHCDAGHSSSRGCAPVTVSTSAAARARIASQMPLAEKRAFAHFEVDTSGAVQERTGPRTRSPRELLALAGEERGARTAATRVLRGACCTVPTRGPGGWPRPLSSPRPPRPGGLDLQGSPAA